MVEISLENLQKNTESIYEAVVAMSKRARQINDEQRIAMELEMDTSPVGDIRDSEEFGDVEIDREALKREYTKYPKPTRAAMIEMVNGEIEFSYRETKEDTEKKEKA